MTRKDWPVARNIHGPNGKTGRQARKPGEAMPW
jgi:hypothetical protein